MAYRPGLQCLAIIERKYAKDIHSQMPMITETNMPEIWPAISLSLAMVAIIDTNVQELSTLVSIGAVAHWELASTRHVLLIQIK